jgi:hypothetical protein
MLDADLFTLDQYLIRGRRAPVLRQKLVSRVVGGEKVLGMGGF